MSQRTYKYNGWQIKGVGGFCTIRHFWASKDNLSHWSFTLRKCKISCDRRDAGEEINEIYLKPLYN